MEKFKSQWVSFKTRTVEIGWALWKGANTQDHESGSQHYWGMQEQEVTSSDKFHMILFYLTLNYNWLCLRLKLKYFNNEKNRKQTWVFLKKVTHFFLFGKSLANSIIKMLIILSTSSFLIFFSSFFSIIHIASSFIGIYKGQGLTDIRLALPFNLASSLFSW